MNAAERIRAYLTARPQDAGPVVATAQADYYGPATHLTEVDLEAVLQTLEILAALAGQRSLKQILQTSGEIDALPFTTVLLADDGLVLQRFAEGLGEELDGEVWECMGSNLLYRSADISLPARVLS